MESQIKKLQEKYWEGETSLEEEKVLREFYKNSKNQHSDTSYFALLDEKKNRQTPEFMHPGRKNRFTTWVSVAASIVVLLSGTFFINKMNHQDEFLVDDPERAYEITRQALMIVSGNMNKGSAYASKVGKFEEIQQHIRLNERRTD